jgi:imidazolonepropionase-like amidohydrolase
MARTIFRGGRVWDGRADRADRADLVVQDGRVLDVGSGLDGDVEVDCTGATVVPGFIDCHVHAVLSTLDLLRIIRTRPSYRLFEAARNLRTTVQAGITTVRDAGGTDAGVRDAVRDGLIRGPRMQVAITVLSQTGGHGDTAMPCGVSLPLASALGAPDGVVDGPVEMRRRAREVIRAGADVLKVCASPPTTTRATPSSSRTSSPPSSPRRRRSTCRSWPTRRAPPASRTRWRRGSPRSSTGCTWTRRRWR